MATVTATRNVGALEIPKEEVVSASAWKETGFGLRNCMAVAAVAAAVAAASFAAHLPIAPLCTAIAVWGVFSATVIGLHRVTEGTMVGRVVRHLYAVVMGQNATIAAIVLSPLAFFKKYHGAVGIENKQRPILLLNGFLGCGSNLHFLRKRLHAKGHGPIYTVNVPWGTKSIQAKSELLKETVQQIQEETGRKDLIIAGHSMGGLVGSYFAAYHAKEIGSKVTDVITIGSPLKGTPSASLTFPFPDGKSMRPGGSKLQMQIAEGMKKHPEICFSHIASELDRTVPLHSALPEGSLPGRIFLLKDLEHRGLLFSSRVADKISAWIKESLNRPKPVVTETAPGGPVLITDPTSDEPAPLSPVEAPLSPTPSAGEFDPPPAFQAAMHAAVAAANVLSVGAITQGVCAAAAGILNQNS